MKKISEDKIIELVSNNNGFREEVIIPIGEDAGVIFPKQETNMVITTDTMALNTHFKSNITPYELGYISAISNISDLSAMGAEPAFALINLTIEKPSDIFIKQLIEGYNKVFNKFSMTILGGDTTKGELSISMTLVGYTESNNFMQTSSAKTGDNIYISGSVAETMYAHMNNKYFLHQDRNELGKLLANYANACTDMSDGLFKSLRNICKRSKLGAEIDLDKICINENIRHLILENENTWEDAFGYGEDYELFFTVSSSNIEKLKKYCDQKCIEIFEIGKLNDSKNIDFFQKSKKLQLDIYKEFEHFE